VHLGHDFLEQRTILESFTGTDAIRLDPIAGNHLLDREGPAKCNEYFFKEWAAHCDPHGVPFTLSLFNVGAMTRQRFATSERMHEFQSLAGAMGFEPAES
jgi:hypothetical protein